MNNRIIAVHLLNDRSGSPLVFRQALETLQETNTIILYTATPSGSGFLSDLPGIACKGIFYRWHKNKIITLFYFLLSQIMLFLRLMAVLRKSDTLYLNTLLPFGAALAGYLKRTRVIYHVHEISLKPALLKNFLFLIANLTAEKVLFVSQHLADHYRFRKPSTSVIYNTLPRSFTERADGIPKHNLGIPFTVSMLCSLKAYKGVYHFINVARKLPKMRFVLVLNASERETARFISEVEPPGNCYVHSVQKDTIPFYGQTHVIMNLSDPAYWVETFGMTALEAMYCGRPVICPVTGGITELVDEGVQGYRIHCEDEAKICDTLKNLSADLKRYMAMSDACYLKALLFDASFFNKSIHNAFFSDSVFRKTTLRSRFFPKIGNADSSKIP